MSQEIIRQALALAHQGQMSQARAQLMDMLRQDPDNLSGWGNLYRLCYNDKERKVCLENILRLRPLDEWATRKLDELQAEQAEQPGRQSGLDTQPGRPASDREKPVVEDEVPTAVTRQREAEAKAAAERAAEERVSTAVTRPQQPVVTVITEEEVPTAVTRQREDALRARAAAARAAEEDSTAVYRPAAEHEPELEVEPEPEPEPEPDLDTQEVTTAPPAEREEVPLIDMDGAQLPDLVRGGVLTVKAAAFLKASVLGRISILVSGEELTDANALLATLAGIIPPDAPERQIEPNLTVENVMMFAAAMLAGGGAMGSLKAPSVTNAVATLENLMARAHPDDVQRHREIIVGGLEVLVHLQRLDDGQPAVTAIYEVIGLREDEVRIEPVFVYGMGSGLLPTGNRPAVMNTIEQMGLALPREVFLPE